MRANGKRGRKDHIIAALTERIPELEPSREAAGEQRDGRVTTSEDSGKEDRDDAQKPVERRSWLRRFFFGP